MKKIFFLILLIICPLSIIAQDTIQLKELTITGIKIEKDYPITQLSIKTDSISFLREKDPFFVIDKISPSIYSQSDNGESNGYSYIRIRGLDQTRINFNLNGIPLNEMEDQGIYFSNMPGFYNYISDISIQRGIGTSKYGNTSVAGSVNMESNDMFTKQFKFTSSCFDNTFKSYDDNIIYSSGDRKKFAYQIGTSFANNYGFKEHSGNLGGSIFYGVGYHNNKNSLKIIGFSGLSENQLAFCGVPMSLININYKTNLNLIDDKDRFNQNFTSINWINHGKYLYNTSLYYNNVNGKYNTSGILFGVNSYQIGVLSNMLIENRKFTSNIGFNINLYKRYHFGSDMQGYYYNESNYLDLYNNTGYKNDAAIYVKLVQKLRHIRILYDAQIRNVSFTIKSNLNKSPNYNWTFINPKIGIKYITLKNDVYLNFGYTRREPTRSDIIQNIIQVDNLQGANPDNINVINIFVPLKSENVINVEFGDNYNNKLFNISADLYFITIKNEFISTGVIDLYSGFMWKMPIDRTYRFGIESNGVTKFKIVNVFYNIQYQKNILKDNKEIPFNPNMIASSGVSVRKYNFEIGFFMQYIDRMSMNYDDFSSQIYSKGYFNVNGYVKYNTNRNISILFNANNILNEKYYIPAGVMNGSPNYYVGELFNYKLSVCYRL